MKKLFCFLSAICFAFLLSATVNAEDVEVSMNVREAQPNSVCIDAFLDTKTPIYGGDFTISLDDESVLYGDINSEVFDVEACESESQMKIAIAKEESVELSDEKPAFSIELSRESNVDFNVKLKTHYILNDNFDKVQPKNNGTTIAVDSKTVASRADYDKEKSAKSVRKDKSRIIEKVNETPKKTSFLPMKVDGKNSYFGLVLAIGLLAVMAFLFGLVFKKYMSNKEEKDNS